MPLVTNTAAGNFLVDGAYVDLVSSQPASPVGPQTGLIADVGTANWGKTNVPLPFVDATSGISQFGNDTTGVHALMTEALSSMPECSAFLGVRVTDGTDTAATILVTDASGTTLITLTAVCTGNYPNGIAYARCDIQSGDASGSTGPIVYRVTVGFPNSQSQVFNNVSGALNGVGAYNPVAFKANFLAAINGTVPNQIGSNFFTATTGSSTRQPVVGTNFFASGGTNGETTITSSILVGTDGAPGSATGIYALRSLVSAAQVVVAALTDGTVGQTLASFAVQENCVTWEAFASGTSTLSEINSIATNNLVNDSLWLASDWDFTFNTIQGLTTLVSPIGKLAGMIAAQPPWQYPGNQAFAVNVTGTDRITGGISSINTAEAGQREQAGILYLGYTPAAPRGPSLGLPHAMTSTGKLISDVRMMKSIGFSLLQLLGQYVGGMMNPLNVNSLTIKLVNDAINGFFNNMLIGQTPQIAGFTNITNSSNNTLITIEQGFIISAISVLTLSAARFILAFVQVGNTVQLIVQSVPGSN